MADCGHLDTLANVAPSGNGCVECLATGGTWVHLRMCSECGHIGCCDNSPGRHATGHFGATAHPIIRSSDHPIIRSFEPGEEWLWCYVDEIGFELDGPPGPSHS